LQFGDYPIIDPDPDLKYPYTTSIESVNTWYDNDKKYVISPAVAVSIRNFKTAATFPTTAIDGYYYNKPLKRGEQLSEDRKVLNGTVHQFDLRSFETENKPFPMNLDFRIFSQTQGQRSNLGKLTQSFLDKDPIYMYLKMPVGENSACPNLVQAFNHPSVPPLRMTFNAFTTSHDGSDDTLNRLGDLKDLFRLNEIRVFNLTNDNLAALANVTLLLPFHIYGTFPAIHLDGYTNNMDRVHIGHFQSYPFTLPYTAKFDDSGVNAVIFTEAQLTDEGLQTLQSVFPNVLNALERLDIQLVGSPPQDDGDAIQNMVSNVTLKLSSLESSLLQTSQQAASKGVEIVKPSDNTASTKPETRIFARPNSTHKPVVHFEIWPVYDDTGLETGLNMFMNLSYDNAFNGLFTLTAGDMAFTLKDGLDHAIGQVHVKDFV